MHNAQFQDASNLVAPGPPATAPGSSKGQEGTGEKFNYLFIFAGNELFFSLIRSTTSRRAAQGRRTTRRRRRERCSRQSTRGDTCFPEEKEGG